MTRTNEERFNSFVIRVRKIIQNDQMRERWIQVQSWHDDDIVLSSSHMLVAIPDSTL